MLEDQTRRPIVELFPSAKAQLIIQGASVTRKLPQAGGGQFYMQQGVLRSKNI
jgi:hypothetical protein